MHESYSEISLPLRSDPSLFEKFINAVGGIRTGRLMEYLDSLAGSIAYKHILGQEVQSLGPIEERGLYVVTAAVDRLDMLQPLASWKAVADLRLSGNVIFTGRSSMEIAVKMEALHPDAEPLTVMIGRFSMVCRDAHTHTAHAVNALTLSTPDEKQLFSIGEGHQKRKKAMSLMSLDRVPPSSEEAKVLHDYQLAHSRGDQTPGTAFLPMEGTHLQNCFMMFPQERNVHGKVFGGYLMRLAYELAYANASLFAHRPMRFLSLDDISFRRPVNIGSIVRLTSLVAHSTSNEVYPAVIHVRVQADVLDIVTGSAQTTNDFRFTWCADDGAPLSRSVVPVTYQGVFQAMMWLEARRALAMGDEIRGLRSGA
ncbi:Thioesterase/thiol ester dehydrase-isomerase [Exidia glandulosa HHB12029]|uniref:Thioesterase/thiol ester dehydrase-isomerase n=1 Tax=Exidia glandulosa HHB12029 TaxID=1314781 RepID=A0A165M943_EXIGL|nr:Thioesterase/thiol ester dehydrase-isomerase [Exidia glandulosa HHB12029]